MATANLEDELASGVIDVQYGVLPSQDDRAGITVL